MSEQVIQIASRVRTIREICELSAEETAHKMGISLDEYLRCERGEIDIPISFLTRAAQVFGVEVQELLTGSAPKLHSYFLCRSGRGMEVQRMNRQYRYKSLAYNFRDKSIEPFHVTIQPDDPDAEADLNVHPGQEFDYILEGIMKLTVGSKEILMYQGDSIYFDSTIPHGMKAIGGPVSFMAVVIPPKIEA